jgi:two-component system, NarL family, sensor kinase
VVGVCSFRGSGLRDRRRKPDNALGWCLVGSTVALALSLDGSLYAIAAYRIHHGTLPLGWVAMLAQPGWAIAIVLIGVAILIFPDGRPASPLLRRVLWLYLAPAVVWMGSAYVLTADAIVRHAIGVDSGGNLVTLDNGPSSPGWWNLLQDVVFVTIGLCGVLVLAGQVASFRRATGERRQQLKWLLAGLATCLVGAVAAIALGQEHGAWRVVASVAAILAFFAAPVTIGVAILKYRLYDIDRIISRTLAYAIITGLLVGVYAGLVLLTTRCSTCTARWRWPPPRWPQQRCSRRSAARLGVRGDPGTPAGSQQEPVTGHYTLTEGERDRAVELGAQVITAREADKVERQRAAIRGESRF